MSLKSGLNTDRLILIIFAVLMAVVGTLGNLFIIGAVIVERKLRFLGSIFVICLAVADLYVMALIFPVMALNLIYEESIISGKWCSVMGFLSGVSVFASIGNNALVAVDRYFCVCKETIYKKYFTLRNVLLMALLSFLYPAMLFSPAFIWNIGEFKYESQLDICALNFINEHSWFGHLLMFSGMHLPIAVCSVCYYKIASLVWVSKRKINAHLQGAAAASNTSAQNNKQDVALYRTLLLIFILFLLSMAPYGVCRVLLDSNVVDTIPDPYIRTCGIFALLNSTVNCFVYGLTNKNFKRGYINLLNTTGHLLMQFIRPCWAILPSNCIAWCSKCNLDSVRIVAEQSTVISTID